MNQLLCIVDLCKTKKKLEKIIESLSKTISRYDLKCFPNIQSVPPLTWFYYVCKVSLHLGHGFDYKEMNSSKQTVNDNNWHNVFIARQGKSAKVFLDQNLIYQLSVQVNLVDLFSNISQQVTLSVFVSNFCFCENKLLVLKKLEELTSLLGRF